MANKVTEIDYQSFIQVHHNQPVTTSINIASAFNKLHKNILQKIDVLSQEIPNEWYELNFKPIQITVDLGQKRTRQDRAFEISKDGFVLLVMGFTGKMAMQIKIAYINAFNKMANTLFNKKRINSGLSDDDWYSLAWLYKTAYKMRFNCSLIEPALRELGSSHASAFYSITHDYNHILKEAKEIIARGTAHVKPKGIDDNWNNVLPIIRYDKPRSRIINFEADIPYLD